MLSSASTIKVLSLTINSYIFVIEPTTASFIVILCVIHVSLFVCIFLVVYTWLYSSSYFYRGPLTVKLWWSLVKFDDPGSIYLNLN